jgi:hypothetical protein
VALNEIKISSAPDRADDSKSFKEFKVSVPRAELINIKFQSGFNADFIQNLG